MDKETSFTSVPRSAHCLRRLEARALQAERRARNGDIGAVPEMVEALERSKKTREYMGLSPHRASSTPPLSATIILPRSDLPVDTVQIIIDSIVARAVAGTRVRSDIGVEK